MSDRVLPFSTAAQAYGTTRPLMVRAVPQGRTQVQGTQANAQAAQVAKPAQHDTFDFSAAARARSTPSHPLAAAKVPGQVSFEGSASASATTPPASPMPPAPVPAQARTQVTGSMPIYTNPASRNVAATGVNAGRLIDFEA